MGRLLRYSGIVFVFFLASCDHKSDEGTQLAIAPSQNKCESPDAGAACCFENMPDALTPVMKIAGDKEPGTRIVISGTIFQPGGKLPFHNVVLYAYHTDVKGIYPKAGNEKGAQKFHGRLHGWCKTGKDGRYEIQTIRPASYPNSDNPQHIHAAVMIPGTHRAIFIGDFMFADDPLLREKNKSPGTVMQMNRDGASLIGQRDIIIE